MRAVVGLFGSVYSAKNAVEKINSSKIYQQKAVILKENETIWLEQLVKNDPKQGAIFGAVLGMILGSLVGLMIAFLLAFTLKTSIFVVLPVLGAILFGFVCAYFGMLYSRHRYTSHIQLFSETVTAGGALVMVPIEEESGRKLESAMRKYGAKLADTYQVHAEQVKRLRSEFKANSKSIPNP